MSNGAPFVRATLADGVRSIWPWTRLHPTFAPWGDSIVRPDLRGQIPRQERQTGTITADGACDTGRCHKASIERDAAPLVRRSVPRTDR